MRYVVWFTVGFSAASLLFAYLLSGWMLWIAGAFLLLLSLLGLLLFQRVDFRRVAAVCLLGMGIGLLWCGGYSAIRFEPIRDLHATERNMTVTVTDYYAKETGRGYVPCTAQLGSQSYPVLLYLYEGMDLKPGNQLTGKFYLRYTATGERADPSHYRSEGKFLLLSPRGTPQVSEGIWNWQYLAADIRHTLLQVLEHAFPEDTAAFAKALLLGETDGLSYEANAALKKSGISHVVSVSGLHVSILYSLIFLLSVHNRKLATVLGIPCLLLFSAIAGFTPSVVRACIVQLVLMLGQLSKREYDPPTSLAVAVLIMLVVNPLAVGSAGLQLSVASVAGILALYRRIHDWIMDLSWVRSGSGSSLRASITRYIVSSISVSVSATLFTIPLCAIYFGTVSLISIVTNLVCLWLITFLFYGIIVVSLLGLVYLPAASIVGWLLSWPVRAVLWVAGLLAKIPMAAVYTQNIGVVIWLILSYGMLIVFLLRKWRIPGNPAFYSAILLLMVMLVTWVQPMTEAYRLSVLDVGQGQCVVLQSEGRTVMVDCGGENNEAAANTAVSYLNDLGITRLDALIITHYDADHAGAASYLMSQIYVEQLLLPDAKDGGYYREAMLQEKHGQVMTVDADTRLSWEDTALTVLAPESGKSGNESSLCILFQKGNCDILITGDTDQLGELKLMNRYPLPDLEYLIVGHHGSRYSTGELLLEATKPEVALISVGAHNRYGHPSQEVLELLAAAGITVRRTDQEGTIIIRG